MTTEKALAAMVKQGYIDKVKDTSTGESLHDYHLGPRGKIEIGKQGTLDFVKEIFGDDMDQDLEKRIKRSMAELRLSMGEQPQEEDTKPTAQINRKRTRRGEEEVEEDLPVRSGRNQRRVEREESAPARRRRRRVDEDEDEEQEEDAPRSRRSGGANTSSRRGSRQ